MGQAQRVEIQNQGKAAAQKGQDQGVGHGAHHIPAHVHAGAEKRLFPQSGVCRVDLRQGGGHTHGHVHHRAQSADHDPAGEQPGQADGDALLPELEQGLHVAEPQAVDPAQALHQYAEKHGKPGARHRAQHGADGLFPYAAQNGQADHGDIDTDEEHRGQRGRAL